MAPHGTNAGVAFGLSQQSADFPLFAQLKPEVAGALTPHETAHAHTRARGRAGVWAGVRAHTPASHARLDLSHATGGGGVLDDARLQHVGALLLSTPQPD